MSLIWGGRNADLQALGAALVVLALGMLWFYVRDQRQKKYDTTEWLAGMRKLGLGVK